MAEALEGAADALDQSKNHDVGQYVQEAGQQIRTLSHTLQERCWNELITDIEDFARCQPTWFVLGVMTIGFMVARFLWTAAKAPSHGENAVRGGIAARQLTRGRQRCLAPPVRARQLIHKRSGLNNWLAGLIIGVSARSRRTAASLLMTNAVVSRGGRTPAPGKGWSVIRLRRAIFFIPVLQRSA
jgi:hypothetical protein